MHIDDPSIRASRLRIGVIGAGRVGSVLGLALSRVGHQVVAASGVSQDSIRRAATMLPAAQLLPADEVVRAADLVLLAVPDDTLCGLVEGLAETGSWRAGQLVVHTSGAHGMAVLAPAAAQGVLPLALHPVMTFTGRPEDIDRLPGVAFGVTAAEEHRAVAEALVVEMGGEPTWVPEHARGLYHAALAHGANHLVTLVNEALDLLRTAGVEQAETLIEPLLRAALDNALRQGDSALTGPVSRGDAGTVRRHLHELVDHAPGSVEAYLAMARRTAERAIAAGRLRRLDAGELLEVLEPRRDSDAGVRGRP